MTAVADDLACRCRHILPSLAPATAAVTDRSSPAWPPSAQRQGCLGRWRRRTGAGGGYGARSRDASWLTHEVRRMEKKRGPTTHGILAQYVRRRGAAASPQGPQQPDDGRMATGAWTVPANHMWSSDP